MSRVDEVKDFIAKQPTLISGTKEECIGTIELMKLHALQDIDLSLAYMVDIFNEVKDQEEKKPVEKTCETCICDPNCKADVLMACGHCYEYSEWEGL